MELKDLNPLLEERGKELDTLLSKAKETVANFKERMLATKESIKNLLDIFVATNAKLAKTNSETFRLSRWYSGIIKSSSSVIYKVEELTFNKTLKAYEVENTIVDITDLKGVFTFNLAMTDSEESGLILLKCCAGHAECKIRIMVKGRLLKDFKVPTGVTVIPLNISSSPVKVTDVRDLGGRIENAILKQLLPQRNRVREIEIFSERDRFVMGATVENSRTVVLNNYGKVLPEDLEFAKTFSEAKTSSLPIISSVAIDIDKENGMSFCAPAKSKKLVGLKNYPFEATNLNASVFTKVLTINSFGMNLLITGIIDKDKTLEAVGNYLTIYKIVDELGNLEIVKVIETQPLSDFVIFKNIDGFTITTFSIKNKMLNCLVFNGSDVYEISGFSLTQGVEIINPFSVGSVGFLSFFNEIDGSVNLLRHDKTTGILYKVNEAGITAPTDIFKKPISFSEISTVNQTTTMAVLMMTESGEKRLFVLKLKINGGILESEVVASIAIADKGYVMLTFVRLHRVTFCR